MAGKHSADSKYSYDSNDDRNNYEEPKYDYSNYENLNNNVNSAYDYDDYDDEGMPKKKFIIAGIIIAVIAVVALIFVLTSKEEVPTNTVQNVTNTQTSVDSMIETHYGYDVLGKIKIDSIGVEQYILDSKQDLALEYGVTKLYGGSINNYGNFCIAGHNKDGIFKRLEELNVGDTFTIVEPNYKETKYEIKSIYSVEADDLKCLLQDDTKIEITLVTCENGSTTRLVVKAEEVLAN